MRWDEELKKEHYDNLDGIRGYAAIGIVLMHVLENGGYKLSGFAFNTLILSFTNLTFLFMMISAFSMCCGYYQKFRTGSIDPERFYKRRYQRIWPYFATLCTLALILSFNTKSIYEYLADLTLAFGLIPNPEIEIIGVGWFLGVVFVFYMLFPFFVFLIGNKKRAWFSFSVCLMLHVLTLVRFREASDREVFIYSAVFFMAGGLMYLYRESLKKRSISILSGCLTLLLLVLVYTGRGLKGDLAWLFIYSAFLCFLISIRKHPVFSNPVSKFLGAVSMEIYLSHMVIYRLIEKLNLIHLFSGHEALSYFLAAFLVVIGAIIFSLILRKILSAIEWRIPTK